MYAYKSMFSWTVLTRNEILVMVNLTRHLTTTHLILSDFFIGNHYHQFACLSATRSKSKLKHANFSKTWSVVWPALILNHELIWTPTCILKFFLKYIFQYVRKRLQLNYQRISCKMKTLSNMATCSRPPRLGEAVQSWVQVTYFKMMLSNK